MKIKLDENSRKFIEIEVEIDGEKHIFKYYEKNTRQIDALKELGKDKETPMYKYEDLNKEQFFDNFKGDENILSEIIEFYNENGSFYEFRNKCDAELGKRKKRG